MAFTWVPEDVVGAIATEGGDATVGMVGTRRYADGSTERISDLAVSRAGGDVRLRIVGPTTSVWREFGSIATVDGVTVVRHDNGTSLGDAFTVEVRPHAP